MEIGITFTRMTVMGYHGKGPGGHSMFLCKCSCGVEKIVRGSHLKEGQIKSCGCLLRETKPRLKHGQTGQRIYRIWHNMHQRCRNPKSISFVNYGGRGITVDQEWKTFENFLRDMGQPPSINHSLDRRDSNGPYCKTNCRWATKEEQMSNMRTNHNITIDGQTLHLSEWARRFDISQPLVSKRLKLGWTYEEAIKTPVSKTKTRKTN